MSHSHEKSKNIEKLPTVGVSGLVAELSRKKELTRDEASFVSRLAVLGSRTMGYTLSSKNAKFPMGESFVESTKEYMKAATQIFEYEEVLDEKLRDDLRAAPHDSRKFVEVMERFSGLSPSAGNPDIRGPVEDCAMAVDVMLGEFMAQNSEMKVDSYMEGNLNNIADHYDKVVQK